MDWIKCKYFKDDKITFIKFKRLLKIQINGEDQQSQIDPDRNDYYNEDNDEDMDESTMHLTDGSISLTSLMNITAELKTIIQLYKALIKENQNTININLCDLIDRSQFRLEDIKILESLSHFLDRANKKQYLTDTEKEYIFIEYPIVYFLAFYVCDYLEFNITEQVVKENEISEETKLNAEINYLYFYIIALIKQLNSPIKKHTCQRLSLTSALLATSPRTFIEK